MTAASGAGPFPGTEPLGAQLAVLESLGDVPYGARGVPFVVQLPERGMGSIPLGRTCALLDGVATELGPHGWKIADRPGGDERRARADVTDDLTALAVAAHGWDGPLTVSALGPWTLAAHLYLARGDRVLADRGAVRDVAASLAAGLVEHVGRIRTQVPGAGDVVVQLDETSLAAVGAGVLPTFSGYSRLPAVPGPELVEVLEPVLAALHGAGTRTVVHGGAAWSAVGPVVHAGAQAFGLAVTGSDRFDERFWETVAHAVERGLGFWAGLPATRVSQCAGPEIATAADAVSVPWLRIGLPAAALDDVTVGFARDLAVGATPARWTARFHAGEPGALPRGAAQDARDRLTSLARVAALLAERAAA